MSPFDLGEKTDNDIVRTDCWWDSEDANASVELIRIRISANGIGRVTS